MPLLQLSSRDYADAFEKLLPRGRVWRHGMGFVQDADIWILMPLWSRLHMRLNELISSIFPCSLSPPDLLTEWEETLGLPDPCYGDEPLSQQQRIAAVCAKFKGRGGQSLDYYYRVAEGLGIEICIMQFQPFRAGINRAGDPLYGEEWAHTWRILSLLENRVWFRAGLATAGDPLSSWGNALLECIMRRIAPAHTVLQFGYVSQQELDECLRQTTTSA